MDYVFYFNVFEAGLWTTLGVCAAVLAARTDDSSVARRLLLIGVTFWIFAGSEVMETQTGAWWKPWWLAVWKGVCIAVLITLGTRHYRWQKNRPSSHGPSRPSADEPSRGQ